MSALTEKVTIRLALSEMQEIERIVKNSGLGKTKVIRSMIKSQLNTEKNINQKILIEVLMILRAKLSDEEHARILKMTEKFKQDRGIK